MYRDVYRARFRESGRGRRVIRYRDAHTSDPKQAGNIPTRAPRIRRLRVWDRLDTPAYPKIAFTTFIHGGHFVTITYIVAICPNIISGSPHKYTG